MFSVRLMLLAAAMLMTLSGCGTSSEIREYVVDAESAEVKTSELLRDNFSAVPFRWEVPDNWKASENDQFSAFAWSAGPEDAPARITISELSEEAGIVPQFVRWGGQIKFASQDPDAVMKLVETIALGEMQGQWVELKGPSETILGMIVPYKSKLWIAKLRAENGTAAELKAAFRSFCESWKSG